MRLLDQAKQKLVPQHPEVPVEKLSRPAPPPIAPPPMEQAVADMGITAEDDYSPDELQEMFEDYYSSWPEFEVNVLNMEEIYDESDDAMDFLRNIAEISGVEYTEEELQEVYDQAMMEEEQHRAMLAGDPEVAGEGGMESPDTLLADEWRKLFGDQSERDGSDIRRDVLMTAESLVNGDRNNQYGDPIHDFQRTADYLNVYLNSVIEREGSMRLVPHDIAIIQILLKVSRLSWSPSKKDHYDDIAGYAACAADCADYTYEGLV